jgi:hypothetical protein
MVRIAAVLTLLVLAGSAVAEEQKLDTAKIEEITKLKGAMNDAEGVFKLSSPRTDVQITVDGSVMPPFMGLTSWAAFKTGKKAPAMVMGDLVLFQDEVNPVMSVLFDAGLNVTALHNHFFYADPAVYFMHIGGEGKAEDLARGVRAALDKVKEIRDAAPQPARTFGGKPLPDKSAITAAPVEEILGTKGQAKDGMLKIVIGRKTTSGCGCEIGKDMGVNTWAAFAGADDNAMVDGDFAVLEGELQGVLVALRKAGINIVAIHHHLTQETPTILFLHYWGRGAAADLAKAVKSALDAQGK